MLVTLGATLIVLTGSCLRREPPPGTPVGVSTVTTTSGELDPLPSWNAGPTRQAIVDFVTKVSSAGSRSTVPEAERVAAFDDNGTLWPEEPLPELAFAIARLKSFVLTNPDLATRAPYQALLENDVMNFTFVDRRTILSAIAQSYAGVTDAAFEVAVHTFLTDARHPLFGVAYPKLAYRPMRELLTYLRHHKFTIYICTASEQRFVRAHAPTTHGVPREHIIGSTVAKQFSTKEGEQDLLRRPQIASFNDGDEKVVSIERHIGRRPIMAVGSVRDGGDVAMLKYALRQPVSLALVVHHDDAARELAYEEKDGATLAAAKEHAFVIASMREDWSQVFDAPEATAKSPSSAPSP